MSEDGIEFEEGHVGDHRSHAQVGIPSDLQVGHLFFGVGAGVVGQGGVGDSVDVAIFVHPIVVN